MSDPIQKTVDEIKTRIDNLEKENNQLKAQNEDLITALCEVAADTCDGQLGLAADRMFDLGLLTLLQKLGCVEFVGVNTGRYALAKWVHREDEKYPCGLRETIEHARKTERDAIIKHIEGLTYIAIPDDGKPLMSKVADEIRGMK